MYIFSIVAISFFFIIKGFCEEYPAFLSLLEPPLESRLVAVIETFPNIDSSSSPVDTSKSEKIYYKEFSTLDSSTPPLLTSMHFIQASATPINKDNFYSLGTQFEKDTLSIGFSFLSSDNIGGRHPIFKKNYRKFRQQPHENGVGSFDLYQSKRLSYANDKDQIHNLLDFLMIEIAVFPRIIKKIEDAIQSHDPSFPTNFLNSDERFINYMDNTTYFGIAVAIPHLSINELRNYQEYTDAYLRELKETDQQTLMAELFNYTQIEFKNIDKLKIFFNINKSENPYKFWSELEDNVSQRIRYTSFLCWLAEKIRWNDEQKKQNKKNISNFRNMNIEAADCLIQDPGLPYLLQITQKETAKRILYHYLRNYFVSSYPPSHISEYIINFLKKRSNFKFKDGSFGSEIMDFFEEGYLLDNINPQTNDSVLKLWSSQIIDFFDGVDWNNTAPMTDEEKQRLETFKISLENPPSLRRVSFVDESVTDEQKRQLEMFNDLSDSSESDSSEDGEINFPLNKKPKN